MAGVDVCGSEGREGSLTRFWLFTTNKRFNEIVRVVEIASSVEIVRVVKIASPVEIATVVL